MRIGHLLRIGGVCLFIGVFCTGPGAATSPRVLGYLDVSGRPMGAFCGGDCAEVYVTMNQSVEVIDARSRKTKGITIPVGNDPSDAAVAKGRQRLYVVNSTDNSLSIIDTDAARPARSPLAMPAGTRASSIALSPDERRAYVGVYDHQLFTGGIVVVDLQTETVAKYISYSIVAYNSIGCVQGMAINSGGMLLYVNVQCVGPLGRRGHDPIFVYSTRNELPLTAISFASHPNVGSVMLARPGSSEVWASGGNACTAPPDHAYDRVGCRLGRERDPVTIIDTTKNVIKDQLFYGSGLVGFTPDGRYAFIAADKLLMVDTIDTSKVTPISLPGGVGRMAFGGKYAYAPLQDQQRVAVLQLP